MPVRIITDDKEIIKLYKSGLGSTKISRIINVPRHKIIYRLKKNGIILEGPKRNRKKYDVDKVIELYKNGSTLKHIAEQLNVSNTTILNTLKHNGIGRRRNGPKRSIIIDDDVFSVITPASSYWAGFMAADGCVFGNEISIHLHSIDVNHLYKFRDFVCSSVPISRTKIQDSCYIRFRSDKIAKDLKYNFNIVPCKSLILQPPPNILPKCEKHYIRGYFDGDGCISKSNCLNFEIYSGSADILEWIKSRIIIHNDLQSKVNVRKKRENCFRFTFGGNKQVPIIMDWLYEDCEENYLERKMNKYKNLLEG